MRARHLVESADFDPEALKVIYAAFMCARAPSRSSRTNATTEPRACRTSLRACARCRLVIGNSAYLTGVLTNPANNSEAMGAALERLGFTVVLKKDLDMSDLRTALGEFGAQALGAEMAVVLFAGHGAENGGTNYLIPVDVGSIEGARKLRIMIAAGSIFEFW